MPLGPARRSHDFAILDVALLRLQNRGSLALNQKSPFLNGLFV
jgi:hypothetical protein